MLGSLKLGFRAAFLTALIAGAMMALVLVIDIIEFARTGTTEIAPSTGGLELYSQRVSLYSLVSLGVVQVPAEGDINAINSAPLFACLGKQRFVRDETYIDITALTVSIIGIENYNRNRIRRVAEIYAQDLVQALGGTADYTIGIAQIRSSLAEKLFRSKINGAASAAEIKAFARSDCGSARLAALAVYNYVSECTEGYPSSDQGDLIECAVAKYMGATDKRRRDFLIYNGAVVQSYDLLFDTNSEFYLAKFFEWNHIDDIRRGECIQFNVGGVELAGNPKDNSHTDPDSVRFPTAFLTIADQRIQYSVLPDLGNAGVVKVITAEEDIDLANQENASISRARRKFIHQYSCAVYRPRAVEFVERPDYVPQLISSYCTGPGGGPPSSQSYIVLYVSSGSHGATDAEPCAATPANGSEPTPASRD